MKLKADKAPEVFKGGSRSSKGLSTQLIKSSIAISCEVSLGYRQEFHFSCPCESQRKPQTFWESLSLPSVILLPQEGASKCCTHPQEEAGAVMSPGLC